MDRKSAQAQSDPLGVAGVCRWTCGGASHVNSAHHPTSAESCLIARLTDVSMPMFRIGCPSDWSSSRCSFSPSPLHQLNKLSIRQSGRTAAA
jgi:hypothetical protein